MLLAVAFRLALQVVEQFGVNDLAVVVGIGHLLDTSNKRLVKTPQGPGFAFFKSFLRG
jgi:hypothetical protein